LKLFRLIKDTTIRLINIVKEHSAVLSRTSAPNATYAYQTSVSRCIHYVANILNLPEVFNTWVYFPNNIQELQEIRNKYVDT
ncbi:hypothetical protein ALC56_10680, partial [Trachymyrmex septentrionalis]